MVSRSEFEIYQNSTNNYFFLSQKKDNLIEKIEKVVLAIFYTLEIFFDPFINFFTQGLSDFIGLETLRHGTCFQNYISIRLNGASPAFGGSFTGASAGSGYKYFRYDSTGYVFVTKDSEAYTFALGNLVPQIFNRCISSRMYCGLSASAAITGSGLHKTLLRVAFVTFNVLFVPTIKCRFLPEDIPARFENDPSNSCEKNANDGLAYRTKQRISVDHIGVYGLLTQGIKGNILDRMTGNPVKTCWGLARLLNPIGLTILAAFGAYLTAHKCYSFLEERIKLTA
jgi:hypothetical protein